MKRIILMAVVLSGCWTWPKPKPDPVPEPPNQKAAIVWLNGTTARCSMYLSSINYMRSKGYEVRCPRTDDTADGVACLKEVEKLWSEGYRRIGISGHSQGGGASFVCAYKAENRYPGNTFPVIGVEPAHGFKLRGQSIRSIYPQIKSPSFQWHGSRDITVNKVWVGRGYNLLNGEKYWLEAVGAPHVPIPTRWINESIVFFDWKLKGGSKKPFEDLTKSRTWSNP